MWKMVLAIALALTAMIYSLAYSRLLKNRKSLIYPFEPAIQWKGHGNCIPTQGSLMTSIFS